MSPRPRRSLMRSAVVSRAGGYGAWPAPAAYLREGLGWLDPPQCPFQRLQPFAALDVMGRRLAGLGLRFLLNRRVDVCDGAVPRQGLVDRAPAFGIDPRLQFPALAAGGQFADQREQVVAVVVMRAGEKRQAPVMLDDPVVILSKTELFEGVVERAARGNEQHRHMQPASRIRRFLFFGQGPLLAASAPEPARVSAELALAPPAYANIAVDPDVHQQAKPQHHRNHSRSAIGNQRQRHPDDRNEAHDHRGVDESIEKEIGRDPKTKQPSKEAAAAQGDGKGVADQDDIEPEQDQAADEAEFLRDHREDEIGLLLGQKAQMGLGPEQEPLAEEPPGAERDLRLSDVVAGPERILLRVEKGIEAGLLIIAQEEPGGLPGGPGAGG